jgi:hypothetical protein
MVCLGRRHSRTSTLACRRFFSKLVTRTDEDSRGFETHLLQADAVAQGMSRERYRALLLERCHLVWHFNPVCAAAASRMGDPADADLQAIGVPGRQASDHSPAMHTLALVGYNQWAAERRHPCSVLGMI